MFTCEIYRYNLYDTEELVDKSSNYKKSRDLAKSESLRNRGYTYRLQVSNYPFRYYENGKDVTDKFREMIKAATLGVIVV